MVYTFDVFDTLITRKTAEPKGVFLLMQERLCSADNGNNNIAHRICKYFANFRINAEVETRRLASENGKCEVTLNQIYDTFAFMNGLSSDQTQYLMRLEIETEYAVSLPIMENIDLLKKYA